jgi:hypothetical protein
MQSLRYCLTTVGLCVLLGVSGCATSVTVQPFDGEEEYLAGVPHILPFTQYKATITWRVTECVAATASAPSTVKIGTKVEIVDGYADDMSQAYLIDPTQLESALSISNFRVTYFEGRNQISTINASSEDRTAQVITSVAAGVGKLAVAAAAGGGAGPQACSDEVAEAVSAVDTMETDLETLNGRVKAAQAALKAVTDKIATMGASVDDASRAQLATAIDTLTNETRAQAAKVRELAEQLALISRKQEVRWPEASDVFRSAALSLPGETLDRWASVTTATRTSLLASTEVYFSIETIGSFGRLPQPPVTLPPGQDGRTIDPASPSRAVEGLPYRIPANGRIVACATSPCSSDSSDIYASLQGPVAQLGYVNVLPIRTRRFGNTVFAAELTPIGGLKSAGYEQKTAAAESMATAFNGVVDAGVSYLNYRAGDETRAQEADLAQLNYLQQRQAALRAQLDDPNAAIVEATEALSAETELDRARIASVETQILLIESRRRLAEISP